MLIEFHRILKILNVEYEISNWYFFCKPFELCRHPLSSHGRALIFIAYILTSPNFIYFISFITNADWDVICQTKLVNHCRFSFDFWKVINDSNESIISDNITNSWLWNLDHFLTVSGKFSGGHILKRMVGANREHEGNREFRKRDSCPGFKNFR